MGAFCKTRGGFTLIEMSIVLVVIGLVIGGVLVAELNQRGGGASANKPDWKIPDGGGYVQRQVRLFAWRYDCGSGAAIRIHGGNGLRRNSRRTRR